MISRRLWLILVAVVLAYVITLALDLTPYVRGPEEWRWDRYPVPHWDRLWPIALALTAVVGWVEWINRRLHQSSHARRWTIIGVGALMLAAPALQLLALRVERLNPLEALLDRAVDIAANGYFTVGHRITDVGEFLRSYPALMPTFPIHPQVHPPGISLVYWLAGSALETAPSLARPISLLFRRMECNDIDLMLLSDARLSSGLAGMLLPTVAHVLTVACVFKLARDRFGVRAGLYAAALWTVVPSAVLFAGNWSLIYPLVACLIWMSADAGLTLHFRSGQALRLRSGQAQRSIAWFFVAGLIASAAAFLELGTIALGLFLALYILARYAVERRNPLQDWRFLAAAVLAALAGVATVWIAYQAAYGVSLSQIVETMYPIHTGYEFDRLIWMFNHPYEYAVFLGLPLIVLFVWVSFRALRSAQAGGIGDPRRTRVDALSLSFGVGLILLAIVDPARDETPRTWMLLMPFAVVAVSQLFVDSSARHGDAVSTRFAAVWALLGIQLLVMIAVLRVISVGLYGLPPRSSVPAVPETASRAQAEFGDMAQLIGYETQVSDRRLTLDPYWQASGQVDHPYIVFAHLLDARGQIVSQRDSRPQDGQPLMTCWQPGEIYRDRRILDLPEGMAAGTYALRVGLYHSATGSRLEAVTGGVGDPRRTVIESDHVSLGPIEIDSAALR